MAPKPISKAHGAARMTRSKGKIARGIKRRSSIEDLLLS
jgi:hypothetical protein